MHVFALLGKLFVALVGGGYALPGLLLVVCEAMLFLPGLIGKLFAVLGRGDVFLCWVALGSCWFSRCVRLGRLGFSQVCACASSYPHGAMWANYWQVGGMAG